MIRRGGVRSMSLSIAESWTRNQPGAWSLNTKLRWLIVTGPCLVLVFTALAVILKSRQAMDDLAGKQSQVEINALADRLDAYFDRAAVLVRNLVAHQKALGSRPDAGTFQVLRTILESTPVEDAQGIYIAFEDMAYTEPDSLQWALRNHRGEIEVRNRSTYDYHSGVDPGRWYASARDREHGDARLTIPYRDEPPADIWMVSITAPIRDADGRLIGVAGVDLDIADLRSEVHRLAGGGDPEDRNRRFAYLVRKMPGNDHLVFALPDVMGVGDESVLLANLDEGPVIAGQPGGLLRSSLEPWGDPRLISPWSKQRLVSWKTSDRWGWTVVLNEPAARVFAPAWTVSGWSLGFGLLGLGLMASVLSIVAQRVTDPVEGLTEAAESVESGNYRLDGLAITARRHDEFGKLARGFRRMTEEVAARERQLRQAQDDLARRECHFRALIENSMDVTTILGGDMTIRYKSPSVLSLLGHHPEELIGRSAEDFIHPDDHGRLREYLETLSLHPDDAPPIEYRFRHKDGSYRTLEARCNDLRNDPVIGGVVVHSRDITERKAAEEALRQLNAELDDRVRHRTAELEQKNEELQSAKEATDQAMSQQEVFLANVAHDLRTPLTIVIGYSEDLLRRARKKGMDGVIPDLQLIVNRGKDLLELINDLLSLSKAMNDKGVELDLEEFDVARMIEARMEGIGSIAKKYGNTVEFRPAPGLGTMRADKAKVWRILMNLLSNACKFTKDGAITVTADRLAGEGGESIVLKVADNGIGMGPEQQKRLFDRFSQVHANSGKMQAGVGLGLSICLLYCKALGGRVEVESAEGLGSTFTVTLPAVVVPRDVAADRPAATPAFPKPPRIPQSVDPAGIPDESREQPANFVLIIDDDASVCELIQRDLGEDGIPTRAVHSGEEGLRLAKQLLPSAIILDVVMPGIDGWAVLAALKTDAKTADIPIIMASMLDERERGLRMGADDYVTKPFARDRLHAVLKKHYNGSQPRLLLVEDEAPIRQLLAGTLREQGWIVDEAGDGRSALDLARSRRPQLILLDLLLPSMHGLDVIAEIRNDPDCRAVPIIVMTAAALGPEDRRRLQGQVERILDKGLFGRDEMLREIRALVGDFSHTRPLPEKVDA